MSTLDNRDLFGQPVRPRDLPRAAGEKKPHNTKPNGYAALPGSGPAGETCGTCFHLERIHRANTYLKCDLMRAHWTGGVGTDIRAGSPACRNWKLDPSTKKKGSK